MDIHDLSLFRRMLCSLSPHIRTWWGNPPIFPSTRVGWSGLSCFSLAICARLPRRANYTYYCPDDIQVQLVFYSTFPHGPANGRPYGRYGRAEAVRTVTHPHPRPFCLWPRRQCAGARALDVPVPPRQLYSDHPTPAPPASERQVSTSAGRCSGIAADELGRKKSNVTFQRVRDQLMAVAVWAGQTASGGPVGGCD